ncbi:ISL3 family transposase, partial [Methylobacterium sp. sgz302542]|uniref:ISL3 family transposase n=1 Tax=Methylobacterium sp. sgz302542 TaxID=3418176 RepID=UPI003EB98410
TWIEIKRQRFKCAQCGATHYEKLTDIDADRRMTLRFREHLERQSVEHSFTTAATINGVHETLIRRLFDDYSERALKQYVPKLPRVLGMDEIYLHRKARFVIGDVENGLMIDMQPSRRDADLRAYFDGLLDRDRVEVVCQDMWKGYHTLTKAMFPRAVTVIDKYHVQRTANYGMEVVRKALYLGLSNKDRVALKRKRALFLARQGGETAAAQVALIRVFASYPAMQRAYDLKERFYDIYAAESRAEAEGATDRWLASVPSEFERPFKPSIDALRNWRPHILRYFEHRYTSGYVERLN